MEKGKRKHNFWAFPRSGTGTKQCGTGTICVLVDWYLYRKVGTDTQCSILDQCECFSHNLVISYLI